MSLHSLVDSYLPVHSHSLLRKQVRMTSKHNNHRPQTYPQHYVEDAQNNICHTTASAQLEISSSIFFSQMIAKVDKANTEQGPSFVFYFNS